MDDDFIAKEIGEISDEETERNIFQNKLETIKET